MDREILFRGKRKDNGEWVHGAYVPEQSAILGYFEVNNLDTDCDLIKCKAVVHKVKRKTVGQYTGLTDKNGKEIFEGDILRRKVNVYKLGEREPSGERMLIGSVIWRIYRRDPGSWSLSAYDEFGNKSTYLFDDTFEIIGNIHDSPEMLEVNKK